MSLGLKLLDALIRSGSTGSLRLLTNDYFSEGELPAFEFVRNHFRRYGAIPSIETLETNGHRLSEGEEPFAYYLERTRQRAVYKVIQTDHGDYVAALRRGDADGALGILQQIVTNARMIRNPNEMSDLLHEAEGVARDYEESKNVYGLQGVTLRWPTLDDLTLGAQEGDLVVIVGRPSMGKSYVILNMAIAAWTSGKSVLFCSMEMSLKQIVRRWIAIQSKIDPKLIRKGELSEWGEELFYQTIEGFNGTAPVNFMAGNFQKTVEDVREAAQFFNPDIIYVDAAYLLGTAMKFSNTKARWEKITEVLDGLKGIATDLGKPVVITVQFNRDVKKRSTGALDLSSIAGADTIPQLASIVLGIQLGKEPYQRLRRKLTLMKHREGEDERDFQIHYKFSPLNFEEIHEEEGEEETSLSTNWMV